MLLHTKQNRFFLIDFVQQLLQGIQPLQLSKRKEYNGKDIFYREKCIINRLVGLARREHLSYHLHIYKNTPFRKAG